ncbi:MAG TPA: prepilin-type N-terminal cleavage/methylation domain-containing protein [Chthoniobacteraceae bacterium]|nr:prepilin-type N-terminal cleavage/methylation domain-containing protein [Chthoniobacteraceae bacterium]
MTDLPARNRSLVFLTAAASRGGVGRAACRQRGFTLLELLTVIAIIVVLAGLILGGMGYAQQKSASARATGEIAALSNLLEAFKADFGDYPQSSQSTTAKAGNGGAAVLAYYLFGKQAASDADEGSAIVKWAKKNSWPESGLSESAQTEPVPDPEGGANISSRYLIDPFGNPYGYSTNKTNNPTFDLWSGAGTTAATADDQRRWITNW